LRIAEALWQSARDEQLDASLTDEQRDELQSRLLDCEANPGAGSPWSEVRARIEKKLCSND
jgi:putative addiction module component (TIGR02574 family)